MNQVPYLRETQVRQWDWEREGNIRMSDGHEYQVNRREFLAISLAVAGGAVTLRPRQAPHAGQERKATRWAFLSDTHVAADRDHRFRGSYPYHNLQRVTDEVVADLPDGVVITGDLARSRGRLDAYENFKTLVAPIAERRPVYLGLGNHDNRSNFLRAMDCSARDCGLVDKRHIVTVNAGPVRMIVLDTLMYVRMYAGMLGKSQRTWLETYLQICDDRPTILFLHHPPQAQLLDARRLLDITIPLRKVKAIVYGHSHRYQFSQIGGLHLINLPASGYSLSRLQPVGWVDARLSGEGGEFTLRAIDGNKDLHGSTTSLRWRA